MKIAFILIVVHFFADFVFQTDKMAKGKSKNWVDLLSHTSTYSFIFMTFFLIYTFPYFIWNKETFENGIWEKNFLNLVVIFPIITFICHTITDYFTSRLNSRLWAEGRTHDFFVSLGADQIYHYVQLFLTYYFLTK